MECAQSLLKALMRNAAMPAAKHEINRSWRFETETPTEIMLDQINLSKSICAKLSRLAICLFLVVSFLRPDTPHAVAPC